MPNACSALTWKKQILLLVTAERLLKLDFMFLCVVAVQSRFFTDMKLHCCKLHLDLAFLPWPRPSHTHNATQALT